MKTIPFLILCVSTAWTSHAQGVLEFTAFLHGTNVVPPSLLPYTGSGVFTLSDSVLAYDVTTDFLSGFVGAVQGPAGPGANAPEMFPLDRLRCVPPLSTNYPGSYVYRGSTVLSPDQIPDLMAGLWYVQIEAIDFPDNAMRGQIVPVPEPKSFWLFACAVGTAVAFRIWKKAAARSGRNLSLVASNHAGGDRLVVFETSADTGYRFLVDGLSLFPANMGQFTLN